jgi:hypothetical protein
LFADLFQATGRRSVPPSILAVVMVLQRLEGLSDGVLVDFRARLRASADPDRIFRVTCELARQVGLVGVRRVLDSARWRMRSPPRTP